MNLLQRKHYLRKKSIVVNKNTPPMRSNNMYCVTYRIQYEDSASTWYRSHEGPPELALKWGIYALHEEKVTSIEIYGEIDGKSVLCAKSAIGV